ncbi:hypothetical protein P3T36_005077 [Kitasatospora sp. MAP12-15]|nr:hypothetical protein [Kitasatospora sp. MAP12-44]MDH6109907.1 hypothetical protein [Kitasatospora sp. MAP12-44]
MTSLRNTLVVAATLCTLLMAGAGAAAACDSANLVGVGNSGFGNACVNGE